MAFRLGHHLPAKQSGITHARRDDGPPNANAMLHRSLNDMKADLKSAIDSASQSYGKTLKIEDIVEDFAPNIFKKFYPRKYAAPGGHTSPKKIACILTTCSMAAGASREKFGELAMDTDPVINNVAAIAQHLALAWMPTYWVGKELAQAALATEPPKDLKPADLLLPLDAMTFILPIGTLVSPDNEDCSWIAIALAEGHKDKRKALAICTGSTEGASYMARINEDQTLAAHDSTESGEFHPLLGEIGKLQPPDKVFSQKFIRAAITLIMLMNARPALVENHTKIGPPPTIGKAARKLATPNWIGRTYRVARDESAGGTHASPHVHWRRGHWRHQAYGPKNSLRKDIWIEPTIIGALQQAA